MNKRIVGEHEAEVDTTPDPVRQQRLEAWLAEYNSLRAEIELQRAKPEAAIVKTGSPGQMPRRG